MAPALLGPRQKLAVRLAVQVVASLVVMVGLWLLVRVLTQACSGSLADELFGASQPSVGRTLAALGLRLAVPFHVMSVGLVVQKRWLPGPWPRIAWFAVVVSGCWLGASLVVKLLLVKM